MQVLNAPSHCTSMIEFLTNVWLRGQAVTQESTNKKQQLNSKNHHFQLLGYSVIDCNHVSVVNFMRQLQHTTVLEKVKGR